MRFFTFFFALSITIFLFWPVSIQAQAPIATSTPTPIPIITPPIRYQTPIPTPNPSQLPTCTVGSTASAVYSFSSLNFSPWVNDLLADNNWYWYDPFPGGVANGRLRHDYYANSGNRNAMLRLYMSSLKSDLGIADNILISELIIDFDVIIHQGGNNNMYVYIYFTDGNFRSMQTTAGSGHKKLNFNLFNSTSIIDYIIVKNSFFSTVNKNVDLDNIKITWTCSSSIVPTPTITAPPIITPTITPVITPTTPITTPICIQPLNGNFGLSQGWQWYRGASWSNNAAAAILPARDNALIVSNPFPLPTIPPGKFLLMAFDAHSMGGGNGLIGSNASGAGSSSQGYFEAFPVFYTYELNLSNMAGAASTTLAYANVATSTLIADLLLDNICIFVSDRPPNLPTRTDPNGIKPIDFGFNYTSCADIDGIWAGFGVNLAQYRANYTAGTLIWSPSGWVPWLISGIYVMLGSWSCIFMAYLAALITSFEHILNEILNIANWGILTTDGFSIWFNGLVTWLWQSAINVTIQIFSFAGNIMVWVFKSEISIIGWVISTFINTVYWWLQVMFSLNGLRVVFNFFVHWLNTFIPGLGNTISSVLDMMIGLWNNVIFPFIQKNIGIISGGEIVPNAWGLVVMIVKWLFSNIFQFISTPFDFYQAFMSGFNEPITVYTLDCSNPSFWCLFLTGLTLINVTVSQTVLYPIVIVGIITSTIIIFWRDIWEMLRIDIA